MNNLRSSGEIGKNLIEKFYKGNIFELAKEQQLEIKKHDQGRSTLNSF